VKTQASALVVVGVDNIIVVSPLGVSPWKPGTLLLAIGLCLLTTLSSARHVHGPGACMDVGATAPEFAFVVGCWLWSQGLQRLS
jgi:hypothetical protein